MRWRRRATRPPGTIGANVSSGSEPGADGDVGRAKAGVQFVPVRLDVTSIHRAADKRLQHCGRRSIQMNVQFADELAIVVQVLPDLHGELLRRAAYDFGVLLIEISAHFWILQRVCHRCTE
jgi:hypothetical protein